MASFFKALINPIRSISAANARSLSAPHCFSGGSMGEGSNIAEYKRLSENQSLADYRRRLVIAKYDARRKLFKAFNNLPEHPYKLSPKLLKMRKVKRIPTSWKYPINPLSRAALKWKYPVSRLVCRDNANRGKKVSFEAGSKGKGSKTESKRRTLIAQMRRKVFKNLLKVIPV